MSNVGKPISKFTAKVEQGFVYEAQQFLKTVYHRLRSRKALEDSLDLLKEAACIQLRQNEVTCGTELATMLVQAYKEDNVPVEEKAIDRVRALLGAFEGSSFSPAAYTAVAATALKWLNSNGTQQASKAALDIHALLGKYLFKTKELDHFPLASGHLARSEDMTALAVITEDAAEELPEGEPELLGLRTVLQVLTLRRKRPELLVNLGSRLTSALKTRNVFHKDGVVAHFLTLLLESLQRKSLPLVRMLRREYRFLLSKDSSMEKDMTTLESIHFGVRPQEGGLQGLLSNIMGSLLG